MQETCVQSLGREDPLEKGMATHSSIFEAPLVAQMVKNLPAKQETQVWSLGWEDPLEKDSMDRGIWQVTVHGFSKIQIQLSN